MHSHKKIENDTYNWTCIYLKFTKFLYAIVTIEKMYNFIINCTVLKCEFAKTFTGYFCKIKWHRL